MNKQSWIKCKDLLPKQGKAVLIKVRASDEVLAAFLIGDTWIEQHNYYKHEKEFVLKKFEICRVNEGFITEWMEMPK